MSEVTIWTYDCVPEGARGLVRDLRLRWEAYIARITARASFKKAHADQIRHFEAADRKKASSSAAK